MEVGKIKRLVHLLADPSHDARIAHMHAHGCVIGTNDQLVLHRPKLRAHRAAAFAGGFGVA